MKFMAALCNRCCIEQSVEELTNSGIKMAEINKLKEANLVTVGAVLAAPTKVRPCVVYICWPSCIV